MTYTWAYKLLLKLIDDGSIAGREYENIYWDPSGVCTDTRRADITLAAYEVLKERT
jgi:hypothetical protein